MKKNFTLAVIFFCLTSIGYAQSVAINTDGSTADASALLDVKSTSKGFLMPRMNSAQRGAIVSPVLGLLVFDTDTKTIWAYNGSSWSNLSSAGGSGFLLPYQNSAAVAGSAFKITNSGSAIEGVTTGVSSSGITGTAANGSNGVMGFGSGSNAVGVRGESNTGTGMIAYSTSGTGLNVSSISGLALNVSGKLKIAGGNTNPSNGAVLTSDASGNAVWKNNKIAFHATNTNLGTPGTINHAEYTDLIIGPEKYDYSNSYTDGKFTVPVSGLYYFGANISCHLEDIDDNIETVVLNLVVKRGGETFVQKTFNISTKDNISGHSFFTDNFNQDVKLLAGDEVWLQAFQLNGADEPVSWIANFYGHLVFAD